MATKEEIREGIAQTSYCFENRGKECLKWEVLASECKVPYYEFADVLLYKQDSQGVVIKVERELPKEYNGERGREAYTNAQQDMIDAGYAPTEPLIEEVNNARQDNMGAIYGVNVTSKIRCDASRPSASDDG